MCGPSMLADRFETPSVFMQCLGNNRWPAGWHRVVPWATGLLVLLERLFWKIPCTSRSEWCGFGCFFFLIDNQKRDSEDLMPLPFRIFSLLVFFLFSSYFTFWRYLLVLFAWVDLPWVLQTVLLPAGLFLPQTFSKLCALPLSKSQPELALSPSDALAVALFPVCVPGR